jgi:hypothetical protein
MKVTINNSFMENVKGIKIVASPFSNTEVTLVFDEKPKNSKNFEIFSDALNTTLITDAEYDEDGDTLQYSDVTNEWVMALVYAEAVIQTK